VNLLWALAGRPRRRCEIVSQLERHSQPFDRQDDPVVLDEAQFSAQDTSIELSKCFEGRAKPRTTERIRASGMDVSLPRPGGSRRRPSGAGASKARQSPRDADPPRRRPGGCRTRFVCRACPHRISVCLGVDCNPAGRFERVRATTDLLPLGRGAPSPYVVATVSLERATPSRVDRPTCGTTPEPVAVSSYGPNMLTERTGRDLHETVLITPSTCAPAAHSRGPAPFSRISCVGASPGPHPAWAR
jgi:hypothetical protein